MELLVGIIAVVIVIMMFMLCMIGWELSVLNGHLYDIKNNIRHVEAQLSKRHTDSAELGRLRTAFRINALRDGHSNAEIDAVLNAKE